MGETVLVTGCSTGIGRATAQRFLDAGWTVYATARDTAELRDLAERGARTAELDVTDDERATAVVESVFAETDRLDCLVNNAGYGQFGPVEDVPMSAVYRQFEVNTFGPLRLIRAALPRMRERGRGTIINVTAGVGGLTVPGLGVYTASKFALESLTDALRQEVADHGVDAVVVEPGIVATDFYDRALDEIESIDHTAAYDDLYAVLDDIGVVEAGGPGINPPDRVAETILRAATVASPDATYRVGPAATLGTYAAAAVRGRTRDRASRLGLGVLSDERAQRLLRKRDPVDRPDGLEAGDRPGRRDAETPTGERDASDRTGGQTDE
ncbi:SDR family oxidoreductase [Halorussus sp. MSC15.2]|uniref:SDR family oxidoreductase n=1 Tax=Halorussus sp. MSC15.2 TaxID=2283638 RepID=UPI0013D31983|nr:SDR family oxidoreductase [Halorussus sp. MSC15.2]NEU56039.1 SDR family oxidoreductase [Halorussus sp. MSC15.2]